MRFLISKRNNLRLYTRAITRTDTLDLSVEKGRIFESCAQCIVGVRIRIRDPARHLFQFPMHIIQIAELMPIVITILTRHLLEMNRPCINTCRCAGLHAIGSKTEFH